MVEGKIPMAARRHVTNKLRSAYAKASKMDRGRILYEVMATTGMGRSTARRALTGPVLPGPADQVDKRRLRPKGYGDHYPRTQRTRKAGQNRHPRYTRGHLGGFPESLGQSSTRCFQ